MKKMSRKSSGKDSYNIKMGYEVMRVEGVYPFLFSFFMIFMSELGDKTQLLVLSFSTKAKTYAILLGVALGSFFSHGMAILFGSTLGNFDNILLHLILKFITYLSFLFFGLLTLWKKEEKEEVAKSGFLHKLSSWHLNFILLIALSIAIGELGDKTFLASIGLGIQYANSKIGLILGAILGMVVSDLLAVLFGKFLNTKISEKVMNTLSGILFLLFGSIGLIGFFLAIW